MHTISTRSRWFIIALTTGILGIVVLLMLVATTPATAIAADIHSPTSRSSASIHSTEEMVIYFPLVNSAIGSLYGRVTENGEPMAGITVTLSHCQSYSFAPGPPFDPYCSYRQSHDTVTDVGGHYEYLRMPTLVLTNVEASPVQLPQTYQVLWNEGSGAKDNPERLNSWKTVQLDTYTYGDRVKIGDFDIGGVTLTTPVSGTLVSFPALFRWTVRANDPPDAYNACIWGGLYHPLGRYPFPDRVGCDQPLGPNADRYVVEEPFSGIDYGHPYHWFVQVTNDQGGSGIASEPNVIWFAQPEP